MPAFSAPTRASWAASCCCPRARCRPVARTRVALDGVMVMVSIATVSWYFLVDLPCRAVAEDSGAIMPVCAWVDGQYGISGVYLGVEAEIGRAGIRRVVERDLTDAELSALRTAAEAVRAKQADVASL